MTKKNKMKYYVVEHLQKTGALEIQQYYEELDTAILPSRHPQKEGMIIPFMTRILWN